MALDGGLEGGCLLRRCEESVVCEFGVSQRFGVHAVCERGTCEFRVPQEFTPGTFGTTYRDTACQRAAVSAAETAHRAGGGRRLEGRRAGYGSLPTRENCHRGGEWEVAHRGVYPLHFLRWVDNPVLHRRAFPACHARGVAA